MRRSDGRFQAHPRFYFFALNTALRQKALRGRTYFMTRQVGMNSNVKHTNEDLLAMGKANFVRLVSAFEHSLAGSAQEKIHQRSDLEAMVEQIEQMSLEDEAQELLQCWREGKDVMQQLSGEAAAAGEVVELEMACAKAESLLFQVLGEESVRGKTTASICFGHWRLRCRRRGRMLWLQKELVWLLRRRIKVMRALHRVPVRAAARSVWRGRMSWNKLYCVE